jgi:hypothetical protein
MSVDVHKPGLTTSHEHPEEFAAEFFYDIFRSEHMTFFGIQIFTDLYLFSV